MDYNCSIYNELYFFFIFSPNPIGNLTVGDTHPVDDHLGPEFIIKFIVTPFIIALGVTGNCVILYVLKQPLTFMSGSMKVYMSAIALTDMLLLITYIPTLAADIHSLTDQREYSRFTLEHQIIATVADAGMLVFKLSSTWLIVVVSVSRTVVVWLPLRKHGWSQRRKAVIATVTIFLSVISFCVSWWITQRICIIQLPRQPRLAFPAQTSLIRTRFYSFIHTWTSTFLFFILPFSAILTSNVLLICNMWKARRAREAASGLSRQASSGTANELQITGLLVAITLVFLVTEGPDSFVRLLDREGQWLEMGIGGDIVRALSLLSNAINFLLYCCCSANFRRAIRGSFRRLKPAWLTTPISSQVTEL